MTRIERAGMVVLGSTFAGCQLYHVVLRTWGFICGRTCLTQFHPGMPLSRAKDQSMRDAATMVLITRARSIMVMTMSRTAAPAVEPVACTRTWMKGNV